MFFEPHLRDKAKLPWDPFKALIVPRPVGWVSTMNKAGAVNLAPFSFFNAFSTEPPIIGFCGEGRKDSVAFAEDGREFVWNMATYDLRFAMNETSAPLPRGESEFTHAGLETAPSHFVRPPRVAASPAAMEAKVLDIVQMHNLDGEKVQRFLVLGQVVGIYVDDRFVQNGIIQIPAMQPIARCGYQDYAVVDKVFMLKRPAGGGNREGGG
ncbi:MAG TPA: flavin reductase family protein [Beijerinckiaceae bacterium]|jgi:flavin reductase (DIM6/NTAB) family NADH-FMN oxidoreductase RutF|nr:flavin reductase family protein [Beijerinckiaceae bacterium]